MTQEAGTPPDFWGRIQKMIDAAVAKLARSGMLRNASITDGGLTIKGGFLRVLYPPSLGGTLGVHFGDIFDAVTRVYVGTGLLVQGPDGQDIAHFRTDEATGGTLVVLHDRAGGTALSTRNADVGFGRPYFSGGFTPARFADFGASTTSSSFETLWRSNLHKQNPGLFIRTRASMDTAATAGEVRVLVNGVEIGATQSIGFTVSTIDFGPALVDGELMEWVDIEIQGRRTSASGALHVAPGVWVGRGV